MRKRVFATSVLDLPKILPCLFGIVVFGDALPHGKDHIALGRL
jgi:hypothetical protein